MTILLTPSWQNTAGGPCAIPDKKLVAGGRDPVESAACEMGRIARSVSRKARRPDNARCEGFFGMLRSDFFEGDRLDRGRIREVQGQVRRGHQVGPWRKAEEVLGWRAIEEYKRGLSYGDTLAA